MIDSAPFLIHPIFIFILIISSNFLAELFPCPIQKTLKENILLKHIFAFLTLLFFAVLVDPFKQTDFNTMVMSSIFLYSVFLIMVNSNAFCFICSLAILGVLYILNLKKNAVNNSMAEKDDVENSEEIKTVQRIDFATRFLMAGFVITTFSGFFIYMGEKKLEYKSKFNYFTFVFGKSTCRNYTPYHSWKKCLGAAFT
jgi:hypothetical protein